MTGDVSIVICPYCKREIPLDEVLTHRLREKLQAEFQQEILKRESELKVKEQALIQKDEELKKYRVSLQADFEKKLTEMQKQMETEARKKAEEKLSLEIQDLQEQLKEKDAQVKQFKEMEMQLRKAKRKLEEEKENFELEVTRRLETEEQRIREEVIKKVEEQHQFKYMEKEKLITDLKNQIEELKHKVEQGSQQLRGEVMEIALEDLLRDNFPHDTVIPIPKGMRGADLLQHVYTPSGQHCGTIIWESKRTKAWNDGWIEKLKEDQREAKADIAALVSMALPKDVAGIAQIGGVWVTDYPLAVGLAAALRSGLLQVASVKASFVGRKEKLDMLYEYLSGSEFRQQIEGIVEAFVSLKRDLDAEKRAMERLWAKREKQIERVIRNTGRMYGSLQGVIGGSIPELKVLELKAEEAEEE